MCVVWGLSWPSVQLLLCSTHISKKRNIPCSGASHPFSVFPTSWKVWEKPAKLQKVNLPYSCCYVFSSQVVPPLLFFSRKVLWSGMRTCSSMVEHHSKCLYVLVWVLVTSQLAITEAHGKHYLFTLDFIKSEYNFKEIVTSCITTCPKSQTNSINYFLNRPYTLKDTIAAAMTHWFFILFVFTHY